MPRVPNYADVVTGTISKILEKELLNVLPADTFANLHDELSSMYYPVYHVQGEFTVALLTHVDSNATECVGVSKRNRADSPNALRGAATALSRAVRAFTYNRVSPILNQMGTNNVDTTNS